MNFIINIITNLILKKNKIKYLNASDSSSNLIWYWPFINKFLFIMTFFFVILYFFLDLHVGNFFLKSLLTLDDNNNIFIEILLMKATTFRVKIPLKDISRVDDFSHRRPTARVLNPKLRARPDVWNKLDIFPKAVWFKNTLLRHRRRTFFHQVLRGSIRARVYSTHPYSGVRKRSVFLTQSPIGRFNRYYLNKNYKAKLKNKLLSPDEIKSSQKTGSYQKYWPIRFSAKKNESGKLHFNVESNIRNFVSDYIPYFENKNNKYRSFKIRELMSDLSYGFSRLYHVLFEPWNLKIYKSLRDAYIKENFSSFWPRWRKSKKRAIRNIVKQGRDLYNMFWRWGSGSSKYHFRVKRSGPWLRYHASRGWVVRNDFRLAGWPIRLVPHGFRKKPIRSIEKLGNSLNYRKNQFILAPWGIFKPRRFRRGTYTFRRNRLNLLNYNKLYNLAVRQDLNLNLLGSYQLNVLRRVKARWPIKYDTWISATYTSIRKIERLKLLNFNRNWYNGRTYFNMADYFVGPVKKMFLPKVLSFDKYLQLAIFNNKKTLKKFLQVNFGRSSRWDPEFKKEIFLIVKDIRDQIVEGSLLDIYDLGRLHYITLKALNQSFIDWFKHKLYFLWMPRALRRKIDHYLQESFKFARSKFIVFRGKAKRFGAWDIKTRFPHFFKKWKLKELPSTKIGIVWYRWKKYYDIYSDQIGILKVNTIIRVFKFKPLTNILNKFKARHGKWNRIKKPYLIKKKLSGIRLYKHRFRWFKTGLHEYYYGVGKYRKSFVSLSKWLAKHTEDIFKTKFNPNKYYNPYYSIDWKMGEWVTNFKINSVKHLFISSIKLDNFIYNNLEIFSTSNLFFIRFFRVLNNFFHMFIAAGGFKLSYYYDWIYNIRDSAFFIPVKFVYKVLYSIYFLAFAETVRYAVDNLSYIGLIIKVPLIIIGCVVFVNWILVAHIVIVHDKNVWRWFMIILKDVSAAEKWTVEEHNLAVDTFLDPRCDLMWSLETIYQETVDPDACTDSHWFVPEHPRNPLPQYEFLPNEYVVRYLRWVFNNGFLHAIRGTLVFYGISFFTLFLLPLSFQWAMFNTIFFFKSKLVNRLKLFYTKRQFSFPIVWNNSLNWRGRSVDLTIHKSFWSRLKKIWMTPKTRKLGLVQCLISRVPIGTKVSVSRLSMYRTFVYQLRRNIHVKRRSTWGDLVHWMHLMKSMKFTFNKKTKKIHIIRFSHSFKHESPLWRPVYLDLYKLHEMVLRKPKVVKTRYYRYKIVGRDKLKHFFKSKISNVNLKYPVAYYYPVFGWVDYFMFGIPAALFFFASFFDSRIEVAFLYGLGEYEDDYEDAVQEMKMEMRIDENEELSEGQEADWDGRDKELEEETKISLDDAAGSEDPLWVRKQMQKRSGRKILIQHGLINTGFYNFTHNKKKKTKANSSTPELSIIPDQDQLDMENPFLLSAWANVITAYETMGSQDIVGGSLTVGFIPYKQQFELSKNKFNLFIHKFFYYLGWDGAGLRWFDWIYLIVYALFFTNTMYMMWHTWWDFTDYFIRRRYSVWLDYKFKKKLKKTRFYNYSVFEPKLIKKKFANKYYSVSKFKFADCCQFKLNPELTDLEAFLLHEFIYEFWINVSFPIFVLIVFLNWKRKLKPYKYRLYADNWGFNCHLNTFDMDPLFEGPLFDTVSRDTTPYLPIVTIEDFEPVLYKNPFWHPIHDENADYYESLGFQRGIDFGEILSIPEPEAQFEVSFFSNNYCTAYDMTFGRSSEPDHKYYDYY